MCNLADKFKKNKHRLNNLSFQSKKTFNNEKQLLSKRNPEGTFENGSWEIFILVYCLVVEMIYVCQLHI